MVELLVVIAIIVVLAGMLLPALSRAKSSAHSAKCTGNVRQIALGIKMYVDDGGTYPPFFRGVSGGSQGFIELWYDAIRPHTMFAWTNPLYRCPAYWGPTALPPHGNVVAYPLGGYGYNGLGDRSLGAGMTAGVLGARESEIRSPANMIVLGDANLMLVALDQASVAVPLPRNPCVTGFGALMKDWTPGKFGPDPQNESMAAIRRRHQRRYNLAFADGHIEAIEHVRLYADSDPARRRWNRDNEP